MNSGQISHQGNGVINFRELCRILRLPGFEFRDVKCSVNLGIVDFTLFNKKVIITRIGRITIQRAENRDDLFKTFEQIIDLLVKNKLLANDLILE